MYFIIGILLFLLIILILIYSANDEGFDGNDATYKNLLNNYITSSNNLHKYIKIIPSLGDIQDAVHATDSKQNTKHNYQAQEWSSNTECIYKAILKFLYDNSLSIDNGISEFNNLTNSKNNLYKYLDDQIAIITNINTTNMQNLANSKNRLDSLKQQLASIPSPDPSQMNNLQNKINNELSQINNMKQPQSSVDQNTSGLYFSIVDGYFNDNTSHFLNAPPRNTTAVVTGSNRSGYTTDFTNISTAVITTTGAQISNSEYKSIEWVGYFYTKSSSPNGTTENWQFRLTSDDASYLWIGDVAKGNGSDKANYTTQNATVDNGGLHGTFSARNWVNVKLVANTYYPIRIQFGNNSGPGNIIVQFKNNGQRDNGGSEISNGVGYYFSNSNNPIDNSDPNPNYRPGGLFFTMYNGYFGDGCFESGPNDTCYNDKVNYFRNNNNYYTLGDSSNAVTINNGPSKGIVNSISDIATGTRSIVNGTTYSVLLDYNNPIWHFYSVEWVGLFYTKSNSSNSQEESWGFSLSSDDASYLWIGDNAKGNGQAPVNYTTGNATINNGNLHGNTTRSTTVKLIPNTYYPIRIQFGENGGVYNMTFTFTPPGKSPTTDGTGYFFSNKYNPLDNTSVFDVAKYNKLVNDYKTDQTLFISVQAAYNKVYTDYQNFNAQIASEQNQFNNYSKIANQSNTDLINSTNFVNVTKDSINKDFSSLQSIYDKLKQIDSYSYSDIYGKLYKGLDAYVSESKETSEKVVSVEKSDYITCKTDLLDADGKPLNPFYYNGYCYYTRKDSRLTNITNPGTTNNVAQKIRESDFSFPCSYKPI